MPKTNAEELLTLASKPIQILLFVRLFCHSHINIQIKRLTLCVITYSTISYDGPYSHDALHTHSYEETL